MDKIMINKSLRSIWRNKKSYISGIFVLAIGLSMYVGMFSGYLYYMESVRQFHIDTNFADVFASVRTMPANSVDRLTRIDGVNEAQGTLKSTASARISGFDELIGVLLVGVDESRPAPINTFAYEGEPLRTNNDIWVSGMFFDVHNLSVGDTIRLLINGRYENFTIQGTVLSPEYLFVPAVGGGFPDERLNTVGFVQNSVVENSAGTPGIVNNIRLTLDEGTTFADVELPLTAMLERYGLISMVPRHQHMSYMAIIQQSIPLQMMGTFFPILLLSIAVGMLYITLKRLITMERTEIGTLKAIGFSDRYIVSGYLVQGALAAGISFVMSLGLGYIIGSAFYNLIAEFYDLTWIPFNLHTVVVISAAVIALTASLVGVLMGAKSSMKIKPAEAMREAAPSTKIKGSKFNGFFSKLLLDTGGKLALRSMQRNKRRVFITVISIAVVFTSMNTFFTMGLMMTDNTEFRFAHVQTSDGTITLNTFEPRHVLLRDIGQMQGVTEVETVLVVVADLENNDAMRTLAIYGLAADANMFNIFDNNGSQLRTGDGGLILSRFFADELGLTIGDKVSVNNTSLRAPVYVEITQLVESTTGMGAYMEISELSFLFGSEIISNMVLINVEEGYLPIIWEELANARNVSGFDDSERTLEMINANDNMNVQIFNMINLASIIICFAIIYNLSNIALGEKQREYATLRVLGFQSKAVSEINTFEYTVMLLIGTAFGIGMSLWFIPEIGQMFSFEQFIIDVSVQMRPTLTTFAGVTAAVVVSCFLTSRQIRKFNLVEVLKER